MNRRTFLVTAATTTTVPLAGCSGDPDHGLASNAWGNTERSESEYGTTIEGTMTLAAGEYTARDVEPDEPVLLEVDFAVSSGGPIDVFLLEATEYQDRYRDGEGDEIQFLQGFSATESDSGVLRDTLAAGEYVLVLDNTGVWATSPDGEVTIDLSVLTSVPPADLIAQAREQMGTAGSVITGADPSSQEFDAEAMRDSLDEAEATLDEAGKLASQEEQATIEQLRAVIAWERRLADAMAAVEAGANAVETANSYFQSDRYDDAESKLETALDHYEDARSNLETARTDFGAIDTSVLSSFDSEAATATMDDLDSLVRTQIGFTKGFRQLNTGFKQFTTGADEYDDGNWSAAIDPLESASETFATAESTFQGLEEGASQDSVQSIIQLTCLAGAMKEGTQHFANAAEAESNGNESTFESEQQQAQDATEQCGSG